MLYSTNGGVPVNSHNWNPRNPRFIHWFHISWPVSVPHGPNVHKYAISDVGRGGTTPGAMLGLGTNTPWAQSSWQILHLSFDLKVAWHMEFAEFAGTPRGG